MHMQQQQCNTYKASFICILHFDEMWHVPGLLGIRSVLLMPTFAQQQLIHQLDVNCNLPQLPVFNAEIWEMAGTRIIWFFSRFDPCSNRRLEQRTNDFDLRVWD